MKSVFLVFFVLIVAMGCQDESFQSEQIKSDVSVENGRLSFKDTKTYFSTISTIDKMSDVDLKNWEQRYKINSLKEYFELDRTIEGEMKHADLINFPSGYYTVLNSSAEVKIGDTIVWYNQGVKYFFPKNDEISLRALKSDPSLRDSYRLQSKYSVTKLDPSLRAQESYRINFPAYFSPGGVGTNGYQYTFAYCQNGTTRKYIHELFSILDGQYATPNGYGYHTSLILKIKLEYRTSKGKWNPAGEYRRLDYYITSSLRHFASAPSVVDPLSGYYINTYTAINEIRNTDKPITLYDGFSQHYTGDLAPYYDVELTGYIKQQILNGSTLCNPYTSPFTGATTTSLLW
jgi:hypothetical protein